MDLVRQRARRRRFTSLRLGSAAFAVAWAMVACGGGGSDGEVSAGSSAPAPSAAPTPSPGAPAASGGSTATPLARADFRVNTTVAGRQDGAHVARLASGGFVAAWTHWTPTGATATEVRLQRFDADARPLGGETLVAASASQAGVAALADGGFAVTWTEANALERRGWLQVFDAGGAARGPAVPLAAGLANFIARPIGLGDGRLLVAYDALAAPRATDIGALQLFTAQGVAAGPALQVNDSPADPLTHVAGIVATPSGSGFAAAWSVSAPAGSRLVLGLYGADGQPSGPAATVASGAQMRFPSIATLASGVLALAWVAFDTGPTGSLVASLWLERFDAGGHSLGRQAVPTGVVDRPFAPRIAATPDGGFVLTWSVTSDAGVGTSQRSVSVQQFDAAGMPVRPLSTIAQFSFPTTALGADETLDVVGARADQYLLVYGGYSPDTDWDVMAAVR